MNYGTGLQAGTSRRNLRGGGKGTRLAGRTGLALLTLLSTQTALADLVVPASSSYTFNGGTADLACTDLLVAGSVVVDGGVLSGVRNVSIAAGGSVTVTSGSISLSGDWANAGTFATGTGTVSFVDLAGCATAGGTVSGNTTFNQLRVITTAGKTIQFAPGSTQTITQNLVIQGTAGAPVIWRSSVPGQLANIALQGTQTVSNFGVTDVAATASPIAPGVVNALPGGNAPGFFGNAGANAPLEIPTLSWWAMLGLAGLIGLFSVRRLARTTSFHKNSRRTGL
jgi:hypothetical protein